MTKMTKNAQMVEKGGISSYSYKTIVRIPPFSTTHLNGSPAMTSPTKQSQVKVYSSRRQESHVQRRRATGAGAGARGCGPHHPPVSRKSPARPRRGPAIGRDMQRGPATW